MNWFRQHLAARLLILIFLVAAVPFAAILVYSHLSEERLFNEHFFNEHQERMQQISRDIDTHFAQLYRELGFLAGSVVMDDLIIGDLDRRVSSLLERYKSVYAMQLELLALDVDGRVIAATNNIRTGGLYTRYKAFESGLGHPYPVQADDQTLLLQIPAYNGLGKERIIGYLVMEYSVYNLSRFNVRSATAASVLFNTKNDIVVGDIEPPFGHNSREGVVESDKDIWLVGKASKYLPDWFAGYRIDRSVQQEVLDELNRFLLFILLFGIVAIAAVSYWFSKRIVAPLDALQEQVGEMVHSRNYTPVVTVDRSDEIGQLAMAFNTVASEIQKAIETLQRENFFRLKRLTQMIGLFNRLMRTELESECLKTALSQLSLIAPEYNVRFSRFHDDKEMPSLYVYDFDHDTLKYYGSLIIPSTLEDEEKAFFRAIASMIASRIEQIRAFSRLSRDSKAKSAFISHMSHDLRTPIHAILSQTQYLIGYGKLEPAELERIGGIEHAAEHLLVMINDLLDLARIDSGKFEPALETVEASSLFEIIEDVCNLLSPLAEQKELKMSWSEQIPKGSVVVDKRLFRQIVLNLLSNAIKYTDRGSVSCRLEKNEGNICLLVQDTGRGIEPASITQIFEPFVQSEVNDGSRGSGLGLPLSKRFGKLFGAELQLFSDGIGNGTVARLCFTTL